MATNINFFKMRGNHLKSLLLIFQVVIHFQRSIQRFFSDGKYSLNIFVDKEFEKSRQVLAAKQKKLVQKAGI